VSGRVGPLIRRAFGRVAAAPPWMILGVGWAVMLVYAFPGQMTKDSFDHLREARAGIYSDAHPPIIDLIFKFLELVIPGQFGMLVLQNALLLAGLYAIFRTTFPASRAAWWATGVFVFPPVLVVMAVIWKDCSMAGLLVVGIACLVSSRRGVRIAGLVALCGATALRYNAFGATLPLIVLLFEWRPGMRWLQRYALSTAAWLAVTVAAFGINGALTDKPMHYWHSSLAVYDIVGTLAFVDEDLPDAELRAEFAGTNLLIDHDLHKIIRQIYSPRDFLTISSDPAKTLWELPLDGYVPAPQAQRDAIERVWWHTVTTYPWAYAKHRLAVTGEVLDLGSHHALGAVPKREVSLPAYAVELGLATGWSSTQFKLTAAMRWLSRHTPLFVPWVYLLLTLVLLPLAWRQRDVLAILLSGVIMESSLVFLVHSRDYRYSHWMVITTTIGVILLATRRYRAARAAVCYT
jgi:hypothetical protein